MTPRLRKLAAMAGLLGICAAVIGCGSGGPASGYDTPEKCFEAMKTSLNKGNFAGFVDCTTEESQQVMAGAMVMIGSTTIGKAQINRMLGAEISPEVEEQVESIEAIFNKHGLDEETFKTLMTETGSASMLSDPAALQSLMAKMSKPIDDDRAFLIDFFGAASKMSDGEIANTLGDYSRIFSGRLADLKTDGDTATATIIRESGEPNSAVTFRETPSGWKVQQVQWGFSEQPSEHEATLPMDADAEFDFSAELTGPGDVLDAEGLEVEGLEIESPNAEVGDGQIELQLEEEPAGLPE